MLKKILLAVAVAIPMFASAQTVKIGIVDTNAVFQAMPETTAAQTKLTEIQKKYQDEFTRLEDEYKRMVDELQKMKEDELPAIRERKTREISDYQQKIQSFMQSADHVAHRSGYRPAAATAHGSYRHKNERSNRISRT